MNIYFSLHYSHRAYIDLDTHGGIRLDHTVVGAEGLLSLLELYLGIHRKEISVTDRQAAYYAAFGKVMKQGNNLFALSWEKNALGVSNECLKWRDALRACGWSAKMQQPSQRLKVLAAAEQHFHMPAFGDRLTEILPLVKQQNPLPPNSCIYVAALNEKGLPPALANLLNALQSTGTKVVYESDCVRAQAGTNLSRVQELLVGNRLADCLQSNDQSFEIWKFKTELDAARYIASQPKENYDVFVTADGKLLDNVQRMLQQPTSGSSIKQAHPQTIQLFKLGMSLFEHPFNIRNLISWLLMPIHPLRSELRHELVKVLLNTGGYKNKEYDTAIENYRKKVRETIEDEQKAKETVKKLDETLDTFIPTPQADGVDKRTLLQFIQKLQQWCSMRVCLEETDSITCSQLSKVAGLCQSLYTVVNEEADGTFIPFRKLESWTSALYSSTDLNVYDCQSGSRWTVDAADIADDADRILWTDCYNLTTSLLATDFLNETEKQSLAQQGCQFWNEADFNPAIIRAQLRPVLKCRKRLVLVICQMRQGELAAKHPLLIRLEQAFPKTLSNVCVTPDSQQSENRIVPQVNNTSDQIEINLQNKHLLTMPATESYTSLENLIQFPLDYVMERILNLRDRSSAEMDPVATIKGKVAHAVIESLFVGNAEEIASSLTHRYTEVLEKTTEEKGAVLLLQENRIEWRLFADQLKECLNALLQIIQENQLTVVAREQHVSHPLGLMKEQTADPTINGFVDMTLQNAQGELFVFDFKWTSSRSYHKGLLEKNASMQLALYERLITLESNRPVVATAYFTLPWHKLYTTSKRLAAGPHTEHVTPMHTDDLLLKIRNSYRYRREQLLQGCIENAEGFLLDKIPYAINQEEKGLVPLAPNYYDEAVHATNGFSIYSCFKI